MKYLNKKIINIFLLIIFSISSLYIFNLINDYNDTNKYKQTIITNDNNINTNNLNNKLFVNKNILAYIYIPNTNINYPITQANNNEYYLNHDVDNKYNKFGSIFIEYSNNNDFSDFETVVSGHSVLGMNIMFSELKNFLNKEFFNENEYFYIITPNKIYKNKIFVAKKQIGDTITFNKKVNELNINNIIKNIYDNSWNSRDININENDHILTLYTCDLDQGLNDKDRILIYSRMEVLYEY